MTGSKSDPQTASRGLAFRPLYKQVEEQVTRLIVQQRWKPGEMLPNEFQLAEEFGVSQGTMRKALNTLTQNKVLSRRQGVGTFVSEHTEQQTLHRFFPIVTDQQQPQQPTTKLLTIRRQVPTPEVQESLKLSADENVIYLARERALAGVVYVLEHIYLPEKYFPGMAECKTLPDTLYHYYQLNYNLTVHKATDRIKALLATAEDARGLNIEKGDPLLVVSRLTQALDGKWVEYRMSRCRSDQYHYLVDIN